MNAVLQSKTFWAGVGLVGLATYQACSGDYQGAVQSLLAALAALGLRHAIAKQTPPADPPVTGMGGW